MDCPVRLGCLFLLMLAVSCRGVHTDSGPYTAIPPERETLIHSGDGFEIVCARPSSFPGTEDNWYFIVRLPERGASDLPEIVRVHLQGGNDRNGNGRFDPGEPESWFGYENPDGSHFVIVKSPGFNRVRAMEDVLFVGEVETTAGTHSFREVLSKR
ncbi:MAG: hypothetical protein KC645_04310 [Gemmatimonadetes bacterium]|nr:hypothetical protein [Gemmatimonadota bacterium]